MDHTLLESFYEATQSADRLGKIRAKSWSRFCDEGLPTKKRDPFRYLPLKSLYAQKVALPKTPLVEFDKVYAQVLEQCNESFLVFINGSFVPALSNTNALTGVQILPLSEAHKTYGTFLANRSARLLKTETDPFSLLNGALHTEGAFLYVSQGTKVKAPIQLLHIVEEKDLLITPRVHLYAGANTEVEVISTLTSREPFWMTSLLDVAVEENGCVFLTTLTDAPTSTSFSATRVTLKRDSRIKSVCADVGGKSSRHDMRISLLEENAEALLSGAFCLGDNRGAHAHVLVEHLAPCCRSSQLFKTLLADTARASFAGKIWVDKEAQKTDAFQLNNTLLLSEGAIAYSEPNLEIFADDVKASHGSTVGQLDSEALFYLTSRGVATKVAKQLLVRGFIGEVVKETNLPCQKRVMEWVQKLV